MAAVLGDQAAPCAVAPIDSISCPLDNFDFVIINPKMNRNRANRSRGCTYAAIAINLQPDEVEPKPGALRVKRQAASLHLI